MSPHAAPGTVVFLNGVSSSGKSSLAAAFQEVMARAGVAYLHMSLDVFFDMLPGAFNEDIPAHVLVGSGFSGAVAAMALAGNNVVADTLFALPEWRTEAAQALQPIPRAYLVGVRCGLETLERRERARGDRPLGQAREQFERVHAGLAYDLELDAEALTPAECAHLLRAFLGTGTAPQSFARLRAALPEHAR